MKKMFLSFIVIILCMLWILGVLFMFTDFVNWVCIDNTRFTITIIVGIILIIKMIIQEIILEK